MSFIWPVMLTTLLLVPLLILFYFSRLRRRKKLAQNFGLSMGFGSGPAQAKPGFRRHLPPLLFLAALTILFVSLARPETVMSLPKIEGTVLLAFDVSGSMAATDLTPTRMEAAKAAAREFVKRQPRTVQIGVIAFSDSGYSVQAPTNDKDSILASIDRLAPQRGTSLAHGIEASLNTLFNTRPAALEYSNITPTPAPSPTPVAAASNKSAAIILLTDGENNENPDPLAAAKTAADRGVRIYTIGLGSPTGSILKVDGFTVRTKLNEAMLRQISKITGGEYFNAANNADLKRVYSTINPQFVIKPEKTEITALFSTASIAVFLIGAVFSYLWFGRLV